MLFDFYGKMFSDVIVYGTMAYVIDVILLAWLVYYPSDEINSLSSFVMSRYHSHYLHINHSRIAHEVNGKQVKHQQDWK